MDLRSSNTDQVFLLGRLPSISDRTITGNRLPTYRQVLMCFLSYRSEYRNKTGARNAANMTIREVLPFYIKAGIQTCLQQNMAAKVIQLDDKLKKLMKGLKRRDSLECEDLKNKLDLTMPFWTKNAMDCLKSEEDRAFLVSMQTDRKMCFAQCDVTLSNMVDRVVKRKANEDCRQDVEKRRKVQFDTTCTSDNTGKLKQI